MKIETPMQTLEQPHAHELAPTRMTSAGLLPSDDGYVPENINPARYYNIPGDTVFSTTEHLPDDQRAALRWLHAHASEKNMTLAQVASNLRRNDGSPYSANTLYKALTGRHGADMDNIARAIADYRKFTEDTQRVDRKRFHKIRVVQEIFERCELARDYKRFSFIFGEPQIGKTYALEEYTRTHNHGETIYVRLPSGADYTSLLEEFAIALRISPQQKPKEIARRVRRCFSPKMLLILDEAHQLFVNGIQKKSVEFIREIYDRCKCGVVLCGTKVLQDEMQRGKHKELLKQLNLRGIGKGVLLPDRPYKSDLTLIAKAFGLTPSEGRAFTIESEVIRTDGLGFWCTILECAEQIAQNRKQKLKWDHVIDAHTALNGSND
jgi:DNA transposition AAA+ family ATPase